MKAGTRTMLALAAVLACAAVAAIPAGASAGSASKSACGLSEAEQGQGALGSRYVYKLRASNISCDKAKRLLIKVNKCRHDNGGRTGSCSGVEGYSCKQKKIDSSPGLFQAKIKCEKGSKRLVAKIGELT